MSNRTLKAHAAWGCLLGSLLLALPLSASDQSGPPAEADTPADEAASAEEPGDEDKLAAIEAYRNCLRTTGSRIVRAQPERCNNLPGSTYSREDIDRTGQTDVGRALERLDPRIRVR